MKKTFEQKLADLINLHMTEDNADFIQWTLKNFIDKIEEGEAF